MLTLMPLLARTVLPPIVPALHSVNSTVVYLASSGTPSWFSSASTIHSAQLPLAWTTPGAVAVKKWPTLVVTLPRKIEATVFEPASRHIRQVSSSPWDTVIEVIQNDPAGYHSHHGANCLTGA